MKNDIIFNYIVWWEDVAKHFPILNYNNKLLFFRLRKNYYFCNIKIIKNMA